MLIAISLGLAGIGAVSAILGIYFLRRDDIIWRGMFFVYIGIICLIIARLILGKGY